jgi:hypothetical protein
MQRKHNFEIYGIYIVQCAKEQPPLFIFYTTLIAVCTIHLYKYLPGILTLCISMFTRKYIIVLHDCLIDLIVLAFNNLNEPRIL